MLFVQIIDGESVTSLRTGLASAVATKVSHYLVSSQEGLLKLKIRILIHFDFSFWLLTLLHWRL